MEAGSELEGLPEHIFPPHLSLFLSFGGVFFFFLMIPSLDSSLIPLHLKKINFLLNTDDGKRVVLLLPR